MTQADTHFTGLIPQYYDQKLGALLFSPFAKNIAARLQNLVSGRVLETAAGTGLVTTELTALLPASVEIVATDLNQPMIDYAASKSGIQRVIWRQADAQALPFPHDSFDAVVCQFGVMFFPDRIKAYREARRVLKPGGRFVFNVWDNIAANPVMASTVEGLAMRYPQQKTWFLERTPCGYHDPAVITGDLEAAGFLEVRIDKVQQNGHLSHALDAAIGLCQGTPMRGEIELIDPSGLEQATSDAAAMIVARCGKGPKATPLQALVVETIK